MTLLPSKTTKSHNHTTNKKGKKLNKIPQNNINHGKKINQKLSKLNQNKNTLTNQAIIEKIK